VINSLLHILNSGKVIAQSHHPYSQHQGLELDPKQVLSGIQSYGDHTRFAKSGTHFNHKFYVYSCS